MTGAGGAPIHEAGFERVDESTTPEAFLAALEADESNPAVRKAKEMALAALALQPGETALDVGCGLGVDVVAMARVVAPDGLAIGVDISNEMLDAARRRSAEAGLPVEFRGGDAAALPVDDESVDACRAERMLVYTPSPEQVVAEMRRVLRPGGRLLLIESDRETWVVDSPLHEIGRRVTSWRMSQSRTPTAGRRLYGLVVSAGFVDPIVQGVALTYTDYAAVCERFGVEGWARGAADDGLVTSEEADAWIDSLREAAAANRFFMGSTSYAVLAKKPSPTT